MEPVPHTDDNGGGLVHCAPPIPELKGSPEHGLEVTMLNPLGFGSTTPGAGLGLVGLSERAELRGGGLAYQLEDGCFVLQGWIPWAA